MARWPKSATRPLSLHGIADDRKNLLAARHDAVGRIVAFVDLLLRHEGVDVEGVRALDLDRFHLLGLDLDVFVLADLVASSLLILVEGFPGLFIHHLLTQPVAGLAIDLVEMRLWLDAGKSATGHVTSDSFKHPFQ